MTHSGTGSQQCHGNGVCSDGLSDFDRVEQYWESEILPILEGKTDVAKVGKKLIEIANQSFNVTGAITVAGHGENNVMPTEPGRLFCIEIRPSASCTASVTRR